MFNQLASPSVCVIDDDEKDYKPLLGALLRQGIGSMHIDGSDTESLPEEPFCGIKVVFQDLHMSAAVDVKSSMSHTANVFRRVVAADSGPVLVIIWSKYADDMPAPADDPPIADLSETEADVFRKILLESVPEFKDKLFFLQMEKPKVTVRGDSDAWMTQLMKQTLEMLQSKKPLGLLWAWDGIARRSAEKVATKLVTFAAQSGEGGTDANSKLEEVMRALASQSGGPEYSKETAVRHLFSVLGEMGVDAIEREQAGVEFGEYGEWLVGADDDDAATRKKWAAGINTMLFTLSLIHI